MDQVILIHGALGNKSELQKIGDQLVSSYTVRYYEIPGHGERSESISEFDMETLLSDFLNFLEQQEPSYIFGFSLGGYLALSAAQKNPFNIKGIVTLGTKFNWNPSEAEKEVKQIEINILKEKSPPFYRYIKKLHKDHLPKLVLKTQEFLKALGNVPIVKADRIAIKVPVRLMRGGKDQMVTKAETIAIQKSLENANYFEIPSFIHPIGFLNPKHVANAVKVQLQSMYYGKLKTDYGTIAYQKIGSKKPNKPTLLFLHEALGSIAQWKDFPSNLCNSLKTDGVVIELPGYGFSDADERVRDARYLHRFGQEVIPAIIEELEFSDKIVLVGHSDGGTNALLVAKRLPTKIYGLITLAAHIINEPETRSGIRPAITAYESGKMKGLEVYHGDKTEPLFLNWSRTWLSKEFKNWSIAEDINNLEVPGLIIQGADDQYGTPAQVNQIADCFSAKVQTALLDHCGHAPHLEQGEKVIQLIKEWNTNLK